MVMTTTPGLYLGSWRRLDGTGTSEAFHLPAHHLLTHGVVVGMTGSGKTGLVTVMAEEALRNEIPVLAIDVKGDLPNLLLSFPSFDAAAIRPWAASMALPNDPRNELVIAEEVAAQRRDGLTSGGIGEDQLAAFHASTNVRVITPASTPGESLHVLLLLERRWTRLDWD